MSVWTGRSCITSRSRLRSQVRAWTFQNQKPIQLTIQWYLTLSTGIIISLLSKVDCLFIYDRCRGEWCTQPTRRSITGAGREEWQWEVGVFILFGKIQYINCLDTETYSFRNLSLAVHYLIKPRWWEMLVLLFFQGAKWRWDKDGRRVSEQVWP
jgi:hypothetical protein